MKKINEIGVQLYTIRDFLTNEEDVRSSFKKLKELGYDIAQTAGCAIPYEDFGRIAKEEGIKIVGTHDDFELMCSDFDKALSNHKALGTYTMGIGGFIRNDFNDYVEFVKKANEIGKKLAEYGGRFTYHNHHHEFVKLGGNTFTTMEYLAENLDPTTTSFVLDTHWVQRGGGDVCEWIKKLTGRIDILHLKDFKVENNENGEVVPSFTEVGNGNLNWSGILEAAEGAGVKYYVVEQDTCPGNPFESLKMSSEYLHKNFM